MRTIKFRAWVNQEGMDKPEMHHFKIGQSFSGMDECPVMQFTGLLDKNGKEIYEGDILESTQYGESQRQKIEWLNSGFWCKDTNGSHVLASQENRLVIGNIYENPELLTNTE